MNNFTLACNNGPFCPRRGRGCTYAHCIEELNVACPKGDQCTFWSCQKWHAKWNCDYAVFQANAGLKMNLVFSNMVHMFSSSSSEESKETDEEILKRRIEDLFPIGQGGVVRGEMYEYKTTCHEYEYTLSDDDDDFEVFEEIDDDEDEDVNVIIPSLETQQYFSSRWSQLSTWYEQNGFEKSQKADYISKIVLSEL